MNCINNPYQRHRQPKHRQLQIRQDRQLNRRCQRKHTNTLDLLQQSKTNQQRETNTTEIWISMGYQTSYKI